MTCTTWMQAQRRRLSGKTALGKALQYALGRWEALTRYADDGRLAIDNNLAERLLRGIAVTRKNFLFLGSDKGGRPRRHPLHPDRDRQAQRPRPRSLSRLRHRPARARPPRLQAQRTPALELQRRRRSPGRLKTPNRQPWGLAFAYSTPALPRRSKATDVRAGARSAGGVYRAPRVRAPPGMAAKFVALALPTTIQDNVKRDDLN